MVIVVRSFVLVLKLGVYSGDRPYITRRQLYSFNCTPGRKSRTENPSKYPHGSVRFALPKTLPCVQEPPAAGSTRLLTTAEPLQRCLRSWKI